MVDQAEKLRQMVLQAGELPAERGQSATLRAANSGHLAKGVVLVAGACPGIGTTTVALQLALHWARAGTPTALFDANVRRPAIAKNCELPAGDVWDDLIRGRRTLREAARSGPCGLSVIAGQSQAPPNSNVMVLEDDVLHKLLGQLSQYAQRHLVVIDVGEILDLPRFLPVGEHCLLVTGPNIESSRQCYAGIKRLRSAGHRAALWVACNGVSDEQSSAKIVSRLQVTCDRCLNLELGMAGLIPVDAVAKRHTWMQRVQQRGRSPLVDSIDRIADRFTNRMAAQQAVTLAEVSN